MEIQAAIAVTLRKLRKAKGMTQEDFQDVASREYISQLERCKKNPTIVMVEGIAEKIGVHPLTFLLVMYAQKNADKSIKNIIKDVLDEFNIVYEKISSDINENTNDVIK